jgi:hypothetical protein
MGAQRKPSPKNKAKAKAKTAPRSQPRTKAKTSPTKGKKAAKSSRPASSPKPAAKPVKGPVAIVGPAALAQVLGVTLNEPLDPARVASLRRALPGANAMLHAAAKALEGETVALDLRDVTTASLRRTAERREHVHALEDIARAVYRSLHEERLLLDDAATTQLQKIARRAGALSEDHPEILKRWRFLRDFLAQPAPDRRATRVAGDDEALEEASAEG